MLTNVYINIDSAISFMRAEHWWNCVRVLLFLILNLKELLLESLKCSQSHNGTNSVMWLGINRLCHFERGLAADHCCHYPRNQLQKAQVDHHCKNSELIWPNSTDNTVCSKIKKINLLKSALPIVLLLDCQQRKAKNNGE